MPDVWQFRCYLDASGNDVIDEWVEDQEPKLQAKFMERMRFLKQQPRHGWVMPHFRNLHGTGDGLGELRIDFKGVEFRPVGASTGHLEYTWLTVAEEKGGKFVPRDTIAVAHKRLEQVRSDRSRADACEFE